MIQPRFVLISGVPRAGKSSFSDAVEAAGLDFTHVPLDRYVLPIPEPLTFIEWLRTPACIAWDHLRSHIAILQSGRVCYTPKPDSKGGWGEWLCAGGPIESGPGRRMEPGRSGYLIPGTHAFSFPSREGAAARLFVDTPDSVIAARLAGRPVNEEDVATTIHGRLGDNPRVIRHNSSLADGTIDGTATREDQIEFFEGFVRDFFDRGT